VASGADPLGLATADPSAIAIIDAGHKVSYGELGDLIEERATELAGAPPGTLALGMATTVDTIVTYLSALATQRPALLLDPKASPAAIQVITDRYEPAVIAGIACVDNSGTSIREPRTSAPAPALPYVMLTTSGSTGNPKVVRLAPSALAANASSIATALQLSASERAPLSLPLFYSYGLSVLTSHLQVGATVVLTPEPVTTREFWTRFDDAECTSLAGVPYTYSMLERLRLRVHDHPTLRTMTQAGGRLDLAARQLFHAAMDAAGGRFLVMYGQTEATARMAVLPHERFSGHEASVGWAIPGGTFRVLIEGDETAEAGCEGEVVYYGPNVMHGYAESTDDLGTGDVLRGRLLTGDRGYLAEDGSVWLTGRDKRITKIFGTRVSLDDVEVMVRGLGHIGAAIAGDDQLVVIVEGDVDRAAVARSLAAELQLHRSGVVVHTVSSLPLLPSGKTDFAALADKFR
jgi:acyl-CoA synthetase (AMP-forming)/AMP-acid ligase II